MPQLCSIFSAQTPLVHKNDHWYDKQFKLDAKGFSDVIESIDDPLPKWFKRKLKFEKRGAWGLRMGANKLF